jgi:hypothetical protein
MLDFPTLEMCFTRLKYTQKLENSWKLTGIAEISNRFFLPDKCTLSNQLNRKIGAILNARSEMEWRIERIVQAGALLACLLFRSLKFVKQKSPL